MRRLILIFSAHMEILRNTKAQQKIEIIEIKRIHIAEFHCLQFYRDGLTNDHRNKKVPKNRVTLSPQNLRVRVFLASRKKNKFLQRVQDNLITVLFPGLILIHFIDSLLCNSNRKNQMGGSDLLKGLMIEIFFAALCILKNLIRDQRKLEPVKNWGTNSNTVEHHFVPIPSLNAGWAECKLPAIFHQA